MAVRFEEVYCDDRKKKHEKLYIIIVLISFFCCRTKNNRGKEEGTYGQASIDNNLQYGEDKEYYQYQYDNKQTKIVDANEMYTSFDYQ